MIMDPTAADPREVAHIFVEKFWIRYVPKAHTTKDAKGVLTEDNSKQPQIVPVEMVSWGKKGQHITTGQKTSMRVSQARKDKQIWAVVGPYYEAWKKGQEVPTDGTPLGAWPAVTPEIVDRLKLQRVRTVEDIAAWNDSDVDTFGMGGLSLRQQARAFCELKKDKTQIQAEVSSQMQAMRDQIAELTARLETKDAPRRGRPPKQEAA